MIPNLGFVVLALDFSLQDRQLLLFFAELLFLFGNSFQHGNLLFLLESTDLGIQLADFGILPGDFLSNCLIPALLQKDELVLQFFNFRVLVRKLIPEGILLFCFRKGNGSFLILGKLDFPVVKLRMELLVPDLLDNGSIIPPSPHRIPHQ